jgi:hypothetical protein
MSLTVARDQYASRDQESARAYAKNEHYPIARSLKATVQSTRLTVWAPQAGDQRWVLCAVGQGVS